MNQSDSQSALSWYLRRLQSMPLAEIPHRILEAWLRKVSRFAFVARRDQNLAQNCLEKKLPVLPLFLDRNADSISATFRSNLASEIDRLCAGNLTLLNQSWPGGAQCDWALDPESGNHWRWRKYTFDIPRRHNKGTGDVKFVWELSRLQHLQVLALGAWLLGREDARDRCLNDLQAWLRDNPPYLGLGYASGIELASRVVSILAIITYLGADTIRDTLKAELWRALVCHGRWIARFPSLHSSANNHLVAESAALFILGSLSPHLPEARHWRSIGWARMTASVARQILPDGAGAEQSLSYLAYTMEWLLLSRAVRVSGGGTDKTDLDDGLRRGAHFLTAMADSSGVLPAVGDCDDSVVLRVGLGEESYPASVAAAIARCLQCAESVHPAVDADLRGSLLSDRALPESSVNFESTVFSDGGYSILRSHEADNDIYLLFDHGPLGFAHTAAHGHADALSVWLHVNGSPVLVDFGTYRYNADAGWRNWARSTAAHNTVEIDGLSQSEISGPFNWGRRATSNLVQFETNESGSSCTASHDGYARTSGVVHERTVQLVDCKVVISDRLSGQGSHTVSASFHFSPCVDVKRVSPTEYDISADDEYIGRMRFDCPGLLCELVRQKTVTVPGPGAVSPAYNMLQAAWSIIVSGRVKMPYSCQAVFDVANQD